jgi:hypothetical protein
MNIVEHASFVYNGAQLEILPNLHSVAVMILFG